MSIAAIVAAVAIVCCFIPAQLGRSPQAVTSHCGAQVLDFRTAEWSSQFVVGVDPAASCN